MIRLQFVSGANKESEAIELFSHGVVSHVDAVLPDDRLLGARLDGGVAIREPDYEKFDKIVPVEIPIAADSEDEFYQWLHLQVGKPYDISAIVAFAVGRDWHEDKAWYCSELIAAGLERVFFKYPLVTQVNKITPADLLLVLSAFVQVTI